MPIDFTLTPEQLRLRGDARAFARDVLSKVESATRDLPTPLARFAATRPFYEQTVGAGFLRRGRSPRTEKPGPCKRAGRFRRTPECAYVSAVEVAQCR